MKQIKRLKWMTAVLAMLLVITACSSGTGDNGGNAGKVQEVKEPSALSNDPIVLKLFCTDCSEAGVQKTAIAEEIKKKFNITLDVVKGDEQKLQALLAGGDLPDVITLEGAVINMKDSLIQSGQVMALDELLDKYGANIKKHSSLSLDVMRKVNSNNTGNVYFLTTAQEKAYDGLVKQNAAYGFFTRWDLYKKIGAPEMNNEDDYLLALQKMQALQPTASNGKKVYALSSWTDWGTWPYMITYPFSHGYTNVGSGDLLLDRETGEVEATYTNPDGIFWKGIKFFNKAYQMGLFDPDGFIQKSSQNSERRKTGEIITHYMPAKSGTMIAGAGGDENAQMIMIPGPFPYIPGVYAEDNPWGWGLTSHAITSNNKNPERTMQLLDYLSSPEGGRLLFSGVEGTDWDVVDGKPQLIGELARAENSEYKKQVGIGQYNKVLSSFAGSYPDDNGMPIDLGMNVMPESITAAEKDFAAHYGAEFQYPGQVYDKLIKENKAKSATKFWLASSLLAAPSEESSQALSKAQEYFMANVAKFVMAKDDASFDAVKQKAIEDFNNMGVGKAFDEVLANYEQAKKLAGEFGK
ncbi:hypothetical protein [Paenibacillus sp. GCM10027626]|uniref:hypothetical protein n=1 Tax=Paenibacillus sp. GCM10027626 TaxID=3273411 RepID=UPI00362BCCDB